MKRSVLILLLLINTTLLFASSTVVSNNSLKLIGKVNGDTQAIILNKQTYESDVNSINSYNGAKNIIEEGKKSSLNEQEIKLKTNEKLPIGYVVFATNEDKNDFSLKLKYDPLVNHLSSTTLDYSIYLNKKEMENDTKTKVLEINTTRSDSNYSIFDVKININDSVILKPGEYESIIQLVLLKD